MPRKIRQLKQDLRRAGFVMLPGRGKGDHTMWRHAEVLDAIVGLDGADGADAQHYQEKDLRAALAKVRRARQGRQQ